MLHKNTITPIYTEGILQKSIQEIERKTNEKELYYYLEIDAEAVSVKHFVRKFFLMCNVHDLKR